jgi:LacI family transcriptional regulator
VLFVTQAGDGVSTELWMTMLHGAEREGARQGLTLLPRDARHLGDLALLDPAVCGLVLATAESDALAAAARRARLPAVTAGYCAALQPIDQVVGADWEAGIVVARYLTGLGHRCIGYVRGGGGLFGCRERWRGLCDGMADVAGAECHEIGYTEPAGFPEAFRALLR